ncbi:MAG: hypothetical protein J7K54_02245, partial [Candidatus Aenigmarchaeota archaeon]|nr:hypothetical protein [Candidatus Aenigmarchaeota archaeon]
YNRALSADEVKALYQQREEVGNAYVSQRDVFVDSEGNVGIGTSAPEEKLTLESGSFLQKAGYLKEVGYIQDDSQGGNANYIDAPRDIVVQNNYLYIVSHEEDTLSIFDVSNSDNITFIGAIRDSTQGGDASALDGARSVFVAGKYAYVVANINDSLSIFDISDPSNITEMGYITDDNQGGSAQGLDGAASVYVSGRYAYVGGNDDPAFSVIDISDPSNPEEIGLIRDDSVGGSATVLEGVGDIFVNGRYAYVLNSVNNDSMTILDISDPTNPTEVGYITDDSVGGDVTAIKAPQNVYVSGRYAYITSRLEDSLSVIDISNASNPVQVSYIQDDSLGGDATGLDGARGIYVAGNYVYVGSFYDNSISVIDISDPEDLVEVGVIFDDTRNGTANMIDGIFNIFGSGKYIYVSAHDDDAISIIEISAIETPAIETGNLKTESIQVSRNVRIANELYVGSGAVIGRNVLIGGTLSVSGTGNNFFAGNLNVSGNVSAASVSIGEALKLKPGSAPANPEEGWLFMNSSDHHLYYYNSTDWVII